MNTDITPTAAELTQPPTGLAMSAEGKFIARISAIGCPDCGAHGHWEPTRTKDALLSLTCATCGAVITYRPGSSLRSESERIICVSCGSDDLEPIESDLQSLRYRCKACGEITQR